LSLFAFLVYSFEGYLVSFLFWPRILMGMRPPIMILHLAESSLALGF